MFSAQYLNIYMTDTSPYAYMQTHQKQTSLNTFQIRTLKRQILNSFNTIIQVKRYTHFTIFFLLVVGDLQSSPPVIQWNY